MASSASLKRRSAGRARLVLGVLFLATSSSPALAQRVYTELLPDGCDSAWAHAVNKDAVVAGEAQCGGVDHAFIYEGGVYTLVLPEGFDSAAAYGINDAGDIVGWGYKGTTRTPFVHWKATNVSVELMPDGFSSAEALGIDNAGVIVGRGAAEGQPVGAFTGFIYSTTEGFTILSTDPFVPSIEPLGINGEGTIVGTSLHAFAPPDGDLAYLDRAFTLAGGDFSVLLPAGWLDAHGLGINSIGDVAGYGLEIGGLVEKSFVHTEDGYQILPTPAGWKHIRALAVNAAGVVIGQRCNAACASWVPFIFEGGQYTEIGPDGWAAPSAEAINDSGVVVGSGHDGSTFKGFISTPSPTVKVTVKTVPTGLTFDADGTQYTSPHTFTWIVGSTHTLSAVSPQGTGGTRRVFDSWSNDGAESHDITVPSSAETYTATFRTQHLLTLVASPPEGGSVSASPSSADGFYDKGTSVELTASPNADFVFDRWTGKPVIGGKVTVNAPATLTAHFDAKTSVTIDTDPPGQRFVVDGVSYKTAQTFSWAPGSRHALSAPLKQGSGATRYVFAQWSDGGVRVRDLATPRTATTIIANYTTQYRLTTRISPTKGGSVTASPVSPDGFYDKGTSVELTAVPAAGYAFTKWTGALTGKTNPQSLTLDAPRTVTATFGVRGLALARAAGSGLTRTIEAGKRAVYRLDVKPLNGFTGVVSFSCSGLPAGAACLFTPITVALNDAQPASLKVTVKTAKPSSRDPGTPPGTYSIAVTGKSHDATSTLALTLVVQ